MNLVVTGDADFHRFKLTCHQAAGPSFEKHMDRGMLQVGNDIAAAIAVGTDIYMPSGYEEIFGERVATRPELNKARRVMTVTTYARGRTGKTRDVVRINKGILKHPVFGRTRTLRSGRKQKNPWTVTHIRPGFFDDPVRLAPKSVERRLGDALGRVLDEAAG
jgi:hypothetical protein